jgi:hypothetical protein
MDHELALRDRGPQFHFQRAALAGQACMAGSKKRRHCGPQPATAPWHSWLHHRFLG